MQNYANIKMYVYWKLNVDSTKTIRCTDKIWSRMIKNTIFKAIPNNKKKAPKRRTASKFLPFPKLTSRRRNIIHTIWINKHLANVSAIHVNTFYDEKLPYHLFLQIKNNRTNINLKWLNSEFQVTFTSSFSSKRARSFMSLCLKNRTSLLDPSSPFWIEKLTPSSLKID